MFLGQETATQVSIDSEKDLRVFINDRFHTNSMCSAVADIKFNVILLRINEEKKIERKRTRKIVTRILCLIWMTRLQEEIQKTVSRRNTNSI